MPTVPDTITKAAAATDTISAGVDRAMAFLHSFQARTINGHSVFADPASCFRDLTAAQAAIIAAWNAATATTWPTQADYDAAQQSGTSS